MAKKISKTFIVSLDKNTLVEKGGAWLLTLMVKDDESGNYDVDTTTAWANPSAAKRYVKQQVVALTPRKSIKLTVKATDNADKPIRIGGELTYKVDA
jgi:hypothetical protein